MYRQDTHYKASQAYHIVAVMLLVESDCLLRPIEGDGVPQCATTGGRRKHTHVSKFSVYCPCSLAANES